MFKGIKCTSHIGMFTVAFNRKSPNSTEKVGGAAAGEELRMGLCHHKDSADELGEMADETSDVTVECHPKTNRVAPMFND